MPIINPVRPYLSKPICRSTTFGSFLITRLPTRSFMKERHNKIQPNLSSTLKILSQRMKKRNPREQLISSAYRVEKDGVKNSTFDRLRHLKLEIERQRQEKIVNLYNSAAADFNEGVNDFNDFIN